MGYYANTISTKNFFIHRSYFTSACRLLESLGFSEDHPAMTGGMYTAGSAERVKKWWAWVNMDLLRQAIVNNDLPEVLRLFRFTVTQDDEGNITDIDFDCKIGNEEHLFRAIARYCVGEVVWRGEEGEEWVWRFKDGEMHIFDRAVFRVTLDPDEAEKYDEIKDRLKAASYYALLEGLATLISHFGVKFTMCEEEGGDENDILFNINGDPIN